MQVITATRCLCGELALWGSDYCAACLQKETGNDGVLRWRDGVELERSNLQNGYFKNANLKGIYLEGANLEGAVLWNANLEGANLKKANLKNALIATAVLQKANLNFSNLENAEINDANLKNSSLCSANLKGALLSGSDLDGAELECANLERAELWHVNLKAANLWLAHIEGADFEEANLEKADLRSIYYTEFIRLPSFIQAFCLCVWLSWIDKKPIYFEGLLRYLFDAIRDTGYFDYYFNILKECTSKRLEFRKKSKKKSAPHANLWVDSGMGI